MKKFIVNVNGDSYEVEVEELIEEKIVSSEPISKPKKSPLKVKKESEPKTKNVEVEKVQEEKLHISQGQEFIESPMPGNIWKIIVKEGQEVKAGEVLLILEAMKMENEILAPRDGIVSTINTKEGSAVMTGEKLVILD